jgi:CTP:molybdopterin cytidylyltransferase MocA
MGCLLKQGGGLYTRLRVGAVLLAAGEGARMGGLPKCLLGLAGVPLINRHLIAMSGAGIDEVVVVTGHHYQQIEPAVETFPVTLVRNPHPEQGQQSSVKIGLQALGNKFDLVLVALADQPLIGNAELTELIAAFKKRAPGTDIVYPEVQGQRGNPVLFTGEIVAEMLASEGAVACRKFIDAHPQRVHVHVTANDRFILDLDTPEDIAAFEQRTGWKLSLPPMSASSSLGEVQVHPLAAALQPTR